MRLFVDFAKKGVKIVPVKQTFRHKRVKLVNAAYKRYKYSILKLLQNPYLWHIEIYNWEFISSIQIYKLEFKCMRHYKKFVKSYKSDKMYKKVIKFIKLV